jgi:ParB/RepB/Spo0J family partition protein
MPQSLDKPVTRLRDLKVSARDQLMLDPHIIRIDKDHNPRDYTLPENREHLDALKVSIAERGTLQPLLVRYDPETQSAILVDGECRLRANLELIKEGLEIKAIPTIQVDGGNEADRLITALTANTGKPLSQWEVGKSVKKLVAFGWTVDGIASHMGKSRRYIADALELSDSPQEVRRMLSAGEVTPALAIKTTRKEGGNAGEVLHKALTEAKAQGHSKATKPQGVTRTQRILNAATDLADEVQATDPHPNSNVAKALLRYRKATA